MFGQLLNSLIEAAALFLLGFVIEAIAIADEKSTGRNVLFNCICTVFYYAGSVTLGSLIIVKLTQIAALLPFRGIFDLSRISDHGNWLAGLPLAFGSLATRDFFYYWFHRLQHSSKWLWAEHALHHSDEHMNVTTASRHHWLETSLENFLVMGPIIVFFRPPVISTLSAYVLITLYGYFIHLNSKISFGPVNRILANPSTHRIHHSRLPEHVDKNFAAFFPLWDVIFGTYVSPQSGESPPTGLASENGPISIWRAITMPFAEWSRMLKNQNT